MLHPSYKELMDKVNSEVEEGEKPIVNSRYSIVIAASRRARQLIAGADSTVEDYQMKKPVSVAVEELMSGAVKIVSGGDESEDREEKLSGGVYDYAFAEEDEENDELRDDAEFDEDMIEDEDFEDASDESDDAEDDEEDVEC